MVLQEENRDRGALLSSCSLCPSQQSSAQLALHPWNIHIAGTAVQLSAFPSCPQNPGMEGPESSSIPPSQAAQSSTLGHFQGWEILSRPYRTTARFGLEGTLKGTTKPNPCPPSPGGCSWFFGRLSLCPSPSAQCPHTDLGHCLWGGGGSFSSFTSSSEKINK